MTGKADGGSQVEVQAVLRSTVIDTMITVSEITAGLVVRPVLGISQRSL